MCGGFVWGPGSWPGKGGVGGRDPERMAGASRRFAFPVGRSIAGHASRLC